MICCYYNDVKNFILKYMNTSKIFHNFIDNFYKDTVMAISFGGSMQKETFIHTSESDIDILILYNDFDTKNSKDIDRLGFYYNEIKIEFIPLPLSTFMYFNVDSKIWLRKFFIGTAYINRAMLVYEDFLYINSKYQSIIDYIINNPYKEKLLTNGVYYLFGVLFTENKVRTDFTNFLHNLLKGKTHFSHQFFLEEHKHNRCEKYIALLLLGASKLKIIDDITIDVLSKIKQEIVNCAEKEQLIPQELEDYIIKNLEKIYAYILNNPIDVIDTSKKISQEMNNFVYQLLPRN